MTTTDPVPTGTTTPRPTLSGIQHVGLTVTDLERSVRWYQTVLGLQHFFDEPHLGSDGGGYAVVLGTPDMSLNVGLDRHPANGAEAFDPTRTGLDHLCFSVASLDALDAWGTHLDDLGVDHSGVYAVDGMPVSLLTFRDPDGIQLELIAFHR